MAGTESLDKFGQFIMRNLRDKGFADFEMIAQAKGKSPRRQRLQRDVGQLTESQVDTVRRCVRTVLDGAIHDFLFALQECHDRDQDIEVLVDSEGVAGLSDGLHGEPFGDRGWQARFSAHGKAPDEP